MKNRAFQWNCVAAGLLLFAASLALGGCASNSLPAPVITSLNPSSATAGGPSFTLKVIGTGFLSTDVVLWNGAALGTQPVSSTELDALVPSSLIQSAGTVTINVAQKPPTSLVSNTVTFTITPAGPAPSLTITKTHTGNFTQGGTGTYTITVGNSGTGPTTATVTVTDTPPAGLTAAGASGTGWSCTVAATVTCARSDALPAGSSYPAITLAVTVATNAPSSVTNMVTVSGGGDPSSHTGSDTTTITSAAAPTLAITKTHTGNFMQGGTGTYTITVSNTGTAPTSATVTVTDTLPTGLTAVTLSGTGWTCTISNLTCARSDAVPPSSSYPAITLTVAVATNAPSSVTNMVTVSGGGDPNSHTANDATAITPAAAPTLAITKTHTGSFTQGGTGTYTITVSNTGTAATTATVTVTDTLPTGLTAQTLSGTGWTCTISNLTCTRTDAVAAGSSYPAITLAVTVATNAPSSVTNMVTVSGGGAANPATANESTTITPAGITVTLFPNINFTLHVNGKAALAVVIAGDSTNAGAGWSDAGAGGSFTLTTTASGAVTIYTAPASVPSPATVTITATSKADSTKSASVTVTIKALGANTLKMSGRYVSLFQGFKPPTPAPNVATVYVNAGTFMADGTTGLLSGLQLDINDSVLNVQANVQGCSGAAGDFSVESDFRGEILVFICGGPTLPVQLYVFRFVLTDMAGGSEGRIISFGNSTGAVINGSGFFKKQVGGPFDNSSFVNGYALGASGAFTGGPGPLAVAAVLQFNGAGVITVSGSELDANAGGVLSTTPATSGSYFVSTDPTLGARGRAALTTALLSTSGTGTFNIAWYPVSSSEMVFVSTDTDTGTVPAWSGRMLLQNVPSQRMLINAPAAGYLTALRSGGTVQDVQLIFVRPDGAGNFTATIVDSRGGTVTSQSISGTSSIDSVGRVTLTQAAGNPPHFYMISNNMAFGVGTGSAAESIFLTLQTATSLTLPALFGFATTGATEFPLNNISAEVTITAGGAISGTADASSSSSLNADQTVAGTASTTNAMGFGTVTLTSPSAVTLQYLVVSATESYMITITPGDPTPILFIFGFRPD